MTDDKALDLIAALSPADRKRFQNAMWKPDAPGRPYRLMLLLRSASPLNATALPSIVIPRLPKAPVIDGVWSAEEWKDAEATRTFVVPMVGSNAMPETRAWMGVDTQRLYLAVYCGLTPGTEPHASTTNHDGSTAW